MENIDVYCGSDDFFMLFHNRATGVSLKVDVQEGGGDLFTISMKTNDGQICSEGAFDFYEWIMFWGESYILDMIFHRLKLNMCMDSVDLKGLYKVEKTCGLLFVKSFFRKIVNEGRLNAVKYYSENLI